MVDALYQTAVSDGIRVHFGQVVDAIDDTLPSVKLQDGSVLRCDLIVAADGIQSRIRKAALPSADTTAFLTSDVCYQVSIPKATMYSAPVTRELYDDKSLNFHIGHNAVLIIATARARGCYEAQLILHDHEAAEKPGKWIERFDGPEPALSLAQGFDPVTKKVFALADGGWKWRVGEVPPLPNWSSQNGKVVLVGDAAHAMVPFAGHGTGQGLEDAAVLDEVLRHAGDVNDLSKLSKLYFQLRSPRVERVHQFAYLNGSGFFLPDGPEQARRDRNMKMRHEERTRVDPTWVEFLGELPFHQWLDTFDVVGEARIAAQQLMSGDVGLTAKL